MRVEVEVVFLYVLAVIAFVAGQAEDPFFQDGIAFVPQSQGKTDLLLAVADASQPIFIPAVGARTGVIVGKIFPGVSVGAVVFADRAPRAFAEIRPPALPVLLAAWILTVESLPASCTLSLSGQFSLTKSSRRSQDNKVVGCRPGPHDGFRGRLCRSFDGARHHEISGCFQALRLFPEVCVYDFGRARCGSDDIRL